MYNLHLRYDSSKYSQTPPKKEPRKLTEEYTTSAKISEKVKLKKKQKFESGSKSQNFHTNK